MTRIATLAAVLVALAATPASAALVVSDIGAPHVTAPTGTIQLAAMSAYYTAKGQKSGGIKKRQGEPASQAGTQPSDTRGRN